MEHPLRLSCFRRLQATLVLLLAGTWIACGQGTRPHEVPPDGWHEERGFRWREAFATSSGTVGFTLLKPADTGLLFTNRVEELAGASNRVLYNGAGVAAGDVDGDGRPDLFLCDVSGSNALFRNRGGLRFENVTAASGLARRIPGSRGAVLADIDGDRDLDLLLAVSGGGVLCFRNDGRGAFSDASVEAGMASGLGASTMAIADVDGNGTPDVYVANYSTEDVRDRGRINVQMVGGKPRLAGSRPDRFLLVDGRLVEAGQPDQLYLNDGGGRFRPVPWTSGAFRDEEGKLLGAAPNDWGLTATFRDLNGDGAPDLYVCNDYWTPDRCWLNDGKGGFQAMSATALRKTPASSMGVDVADVDRDGDMDLFIVDMLSRRPALRKRQGTAQPMVPAPPGIDASRRQVMRNVLLLARGDGTYSEAAQQAGLHATDWSWSPVFLDVDLDGYEDLVVSAGHFRDVQDLDSEARIQSLQHPWKGNPDDPERQRAFTRELMEHYRIYPSLDMPVGGFRNLRDGRFEEATRAWGLDHPGVHHGMALADLDGDGDADLVANTLNGPAKVFRNDASGPRVGVRLKGRAPNTQAVGARVTLVCPTLPAQTTEVTVGGRYLSGSDPALVFAAVREADMELRVRWRGGRETRVRGVRAQRVYEVEEMPEDAPNAAKDPSTAAAPKRAAWLAPWDGGLVHRHMETPYPDEDVQPLLPHKLSQLGPGVAWIDVDGDGDDDLLVGSGRGGPLACYQNDGKGGFKLMEPWPIAAASDDLAGIVGWPVPGDAARVWVAQQGYEARGAARVLEWTAGKPGAAAQPVAGLDMTNVSALAWGMAPDGSPLLFVGGGVMPGAYPKGAPSRLLRMQGGLWQADLRGRDLEGIGIVNAAVWTDLDGDGHAELVVAPEWGAIRVYRVAAAALADVTQALGMDRWTGWWRSVHAADLDGDGAMDLIAGNWGLNTPQRAGPGRPLVFAWGQVSQPGVTDVIQTEWVDGSLHPRLPLRFLAASMPQVPQFFTNHAEYSEATLARVLGDRAPLSRRVEANTLESMVFLNRTNRMEGRVLPGEAQRAPVFGLGVADFNGDGRMDVFLAQNFSQVPAEDVSFNSGLGLVLAGDGSGGFRPLEPLESGIQLPGDQRGAAVADFDKDGRPDLAVAQNAAETRMFRGEAGEPGLRVRLEGPPSNPAGVGAVVRGEHAGGMGPVFEVHAGSGYWSQDSTTILVPRPTPLVALRIRFPGGLWRRVEVTGDAREVQFSTSGDLKVLR
ncbi:MAG: FG-GAP repeat domain-containing protein [Verrucomicrobiota bacterium]